MKKHILNMIKGEILNAEESRMIQGGYDGSGCNYQRCTRSYPPSTYQVWCGSYYLSLYWDQSTYQWCRM